MCCRPLSCPLARLASQARFPPRWLSLAGAITIGLTSEGRVLAGISRFFGGRHSLLRSWFDFMMSENLVPHFPLSFLALLRSLLVSACLANRVCPLTDWLEARMGMG